MAKKNFISKPKKGVNTPWLNNVVKSMGGITNDVIKDIMPNIHDVTSTTAKSTVNIAKTIRSSKTTNVMAALKGNQYIKASNTVFKNILDDLKTGNFNNEQRVMDEMMKSHGDDMDDSGTFFDDWGNDEDDSSSSININAADNSATMGMTIAISDEIHRGSVAQVQAQKASMDTMVALSSTHMAQQAELGNRMIGHLQNIESNMEALVEFNRSTFTEFIEASKAYMNRMGEQIDGFVGSSDKMDPSAVYRSNDGGIQTSNYKKMVQQNFKDYVSKSELGMVSSLLSGDTLAMMTANPLGAITKIAMENMTPKLLKSSMEAIDESFASFVPTMLSKIAGMADTYDIGLMGNAKRAFGNIFGVKNKHKDGFDMENKITKKAVPFDQISRHALTEIIPKYLREQTAYLKAMSESMGVNSKGALKDSKIFDYESGKYISLDKAQENLYGQIKDSVVGKFNSNKFGANLRTRHNLTNEKDIEEYSDLLDNFFLSLEKHGKFLDVTNQDSGSDLDKIIKELGASQGLENLLRGALQVSAKDPSLSLAANTGIQVASASRSNTIKAMEDDPGFYNLYAMELGESIDEAIKSTFSSTIGTSETSKKQGTLSDIMSDVRFLLNRGINVHVVKGKPFGDMDGGSSRTTRTTTVTTSTSSTPSTTTSTDDSGTVIDNNRSAEDYAREIESIETYERETSGTVKHLQNAMHALAFGSGKQAYTELSKIFTDSLSNTFEKINTDFIQPMKLNLFGTKDADKYSRDGLFSEVQNKAFESYKFFQREFTGKGYTKADGTKIADKQEGEESVVGNIKKSFKTITNSLSDYIFGEKITDEDGNTKRDKKTSTFMGNALASIKEGFDGWSEFIFGKRDDGTNQKTLEKVKEYTAKALPATITGGAGGAVIGAMSGGSLLGTMFGGPIGGAIIGATTGFISKNEKFQEFMFGKDLEDGTRKQGIITDKVQDAFKKNKTAIIGGAGLGLMKSIVLGGGGLIGGVVGGPVAGAALGITAGLVSKSTLWHDFLYGKEGGWNKGLIPMFNGIFKGNKEKDENEGPKGSKLLGMTALGTLGGGITGALVSQMGLFGAVASPLGPLGGALAGLAFSINASKNGFREYLFGKKDKDGNKVSVGLFEKFGNMVNAEIIEPFQFGLANFFEDGKDFIIDKMIAPIEFAIEPFAQGLKSVVDTMSAKFEKFSHDVGEKIYKTVIDPIVTNVQKYILSPMRQTFSMLFKGLWGITKTMIATPFDMLASATNFMDARNKDASIKRVKDENIRDNGLLGGTLKNLGITFRVGNAREEAKHKYVDYDDWNERRRIYEEDYQQRKDARVANRKERERINYNHRLMSRMTGGERLEDTEENRAYAQRMYDEKRSKNKLFRWRMDAGFKGDASDNTVEGRVETNAELDRNADNPKASTDRRLLGQVIRIADILGGKGRKNKKNKNNESSASEDTTLNMNESSTSEDTTRDGNRGRYQTGDAPKSLNSLLFGILNDAGVVDDRLAKLKGLASKFKIPGFAKGGVTSGGTVLVGEDGPELAQLPNGTRIHPNNKPIRVTIDGISDNAANKLNKNTPNIKASKKSKPSGYDKVRKEGSYENIMEEEKELRAEERQMELIEAVREGNEEQVKHHSIWDSIFSKKGLITGALIAAIPLLIKFFPQIKDFVSSIGTVITNAIVGPLMSISSAIGRIIEKLFGGDPQGEGGESVPQRIETEIGEVTDFINTGDISHFIAPDGEFDHQSGSKVNALLHLPQYANKLLNTPVGKVTTGALKFADKAAGTVVQNGKNLANTVSDLATMHKAGGIRNFATTVDSFAKAGVDDAVGMAADSFGITLKTTGKETATNPSFVKGIAGALNTIWSAIVSGLKKAGGTIISKSPKFIDDIVEFCVRYSGRIMAKVGPLLGAKAGVAATGVGAVALAALEVTTISLSAINGLSGAARLFKVPEDAVDAWMITISSVLSGFLGSTPGSILDIINEFATSIIGVDIISELATLAYDLVASDTDFSALLQSQNTWEAKYQADRDATINEQYNTYLKTNNKTASEFTIDEYKAGLSNGTISANVDSFATWNDEKNQTWGSKTMTALGDVGSGIASGWNNMVGAIAGKSETTYTDGLGNTWVKGDGPMYKVYDSAGNYLGEQHKDNINGSFTENTVNTKGFIGHAGDFFTNVGTKTMDGLKTAGNWIGDKASAVGNWVGDKASAAKNWVGDKASAVGNWVGDKASAAKNWVGDKVTMVTDGIGKGINFAKDIGADVMEGIKHIPTMSEIIKKSYKDGEDYTTYINKDLTSGLSEGNVLKGILDTVGIGMKIVTLPGMIISGIGNKIKTNVIDPVVNAAKSTGSDILSNYEAIKSKADAGDLSGMWNTKIDTDEENSIGWITNASGFVNKLVLSPDAAFRFIGKTIRTKLIEPAITSAKSTGSDILSNYNKLKSKADAGDISGLWNTDTSADGEDSVGWITEASGFVNKLVLSPDAAFRYAGKTLRDKVIKPVIATAKSTGNDILSNYGKLKSKADAGDVSGLWSTDTSTSGEESISWITEASGFVNKLVMSPNAAFRYVGKTVRTKIIEPVVTAAKSTGSDILSNYGKLKAKADSGDISGLWSTVTTTDGDESVGWLTSAAGFATKLALSPNTAFHYVGNKVEEFIGNTVSSVKNIGNDIKSYVSKAAQYTDITKDISGLDSLVLGGEDPVSKVLNAIVGGVMKTYVGIMRGIGEMADWVTDIPGAVVDSAKQGVTNAWDTVTTTAGNAWDGVTNATNNLMTGFMNMGRGGKGGPNKPYQVIQGGRGTDIPYYSQNDPKWKNSSYGNETMGEAGCGPNAMAMVASGLNGGSGNSPIDFAKYAERKGYRDHTGTSWDFIDDATRSSGLQANKQYSPNANFIGSELSKGNPVILSGQGGSGTPYTSQGHYVVATGMDKRGNVMINDPRGKEYSGAYSMDAVSGGANIGWGMNKSNGGYGIIRGGRNLMSTTLMGLTNSNTNTSTNTTSQNVASTGLQLNSTNPFSTNYLSLHSGTSAANNTSNTQASNMLYNQSSNKLEQARAAVVGTMLQLQGKLRYSQESDRETVLQALSTGHAAGDCSSLCRHIYKAVLGIEIGTYTGAQIDNKLGVDVDENRNGLPNEANLLPGDLLYFSKKNSSTVGHVEMYIGNGQIAGHGGPKDGPTIKDMNEYCTSRNNAGKGYMKSRRWITDANVTTVTLPTGSSYASGNMAGNASVGVGSTFANSEPMSIFDTIGSFFSQFGQKALDGLLTGNWDTNYSFGNTSGSTSTNLFATTSDATAVPLSGNGVAEQVWNYFKALGYSDEAVAGILGNMQQESTMNPTTLQNGKGPAAGIVQWENYITQSSRWKELDDYAKSKNTSWTDLKTQLEHIEHEMNGQGNHMTWSRAKRVAGEQNVVPYSSLAEFKQATDIPGATLAFQEAFERPTWEKSHYPKRVTYANDYYGQFRGTGGGRGGDVGDTKSPVNVKEYMFNTDAMMEAKKHTSGGRISRNDFKQSNGFITPVKGGRGDDSNMINTLNRIALLLEKIAQSTMSSDEKLSLLKELGGSINLNSNSGKTIVMPSEQVIMPEKRTSNTATKIAQGF